MMLPPKQLVRYEFVYADKLGMARRVDIEAVNMHEAMVQFTQENSYERIIGITAKEAVDAEATSP